MLNTAAVSVLVNDDTKKSITIGDLGLNARYKCAVIAGMVSADEQDHTE